MYISSFACVPCIPWFPFFGLGCREIRRLAPFYKAIAAERARMEFSHTIYLGLGRYLIIQADRPVTGIDQKPAKPLACEILGCAHGGREHSARLISPAPIRLSPGNGH